MQLMDGEQRNRREREYFWIAEQHLTSRAKWILKYRTDLRKRIIDPPIGARKGRVFRILDRWGIPWFYTSGLVRQPLYTAFSIDAPNLPRPLQLQHCFRKENIRPLRLIVEIDGTAFRCALYYAGSVGASEVGGKYPGGPEGDIDCILDLADNIISDRRVILRYVHWDEVGMGSGLFPITTDVLVAPDEPIHPPPNYPSLQSAAEAIVYTWTGKGDHQLIAPRYAEMRARKGV